MNVEVVVRYFPRISYRNPMSWDDSLLMGTRRRSLALLTAVLAAAAGLQSGGVAAQEPDPLVQSSLDALGKLVSPENCTKKDAADGNVENGIELLYVFCDDGLPPAGGGESGIPVPAKYAATEGNDWSGLPAPASAEETAEAAATDDIQPEGDNHITLDVDITLPPSAASVLFPEDPPRGAPASGNPVIVFMHGCCGGNKTSWEANSIDGTNELWHHSNAWFASRGYVVVNYTARGFRNGNDEGSTGSTQLDSRRYEINDYQYLVGLLSDLDRQRDETDQPPLFMINPRKIGAVGGSYGGGFAWLALTDPTWKSPLNKTNLKLGAVVTKYGWTDLVEALVPAGHYLDKTPNGGTSIAPTDPAQALSRNPIGVEKQSIVAGLYGTGNAPNGNHTTFPAYLHEVYARLQAGEPYDGDATLEAIADTFLNDRSAYFQTSYWNRVKNGLKVPLYAAATWTDPLFPTMETIRFYNKLKQVSPKYPITMTLGDYQHFTHNKPKEWGDVCGADHHVCTVDDYRTATGKLALGKPKDRKHVGINSRMNKFLDFHLRGKGKRPASNVTSTTQICPSNATDKYKLDEPGIEYKAPTWRALTGGKPFRLGWGGGGVATTTTSTAAVDGHSADSDPVARQTQGDKCYTTSQANPGPGVVQLISNELKTPVTMAGLPLMELKYETTATDYWIAGRLFDQAPDGSLTLVTRGVCRVNTAASDRTCEVFQLFGNSWTFAKGHKIVVELSQSDQPFLRRDNFPSTISYPDVKITIPTVRGKFKADWR